MTRRDWLTAAAVSANGSARAAEPVRITVDSGSIVQKRFGGIGFHNFHQLHPVPKRAAAEVFGKRWRELNPSFARVTHIWNRRPNEPDNVAAHLAELRSTATEVYLTTWDPVDAPTEQDRRAYAVKVVDMLEDLVRKQGAANLRYYCLTNELSLKGWGLLRNDLPKFRDYHQKFHDELQSRKLDIGLLATDASPVQYWNTIEWAAQNMDAITAVYGGHHYFNDMPPDDLNFHSWFHEKLRWGAGIAASRGKGFIVGEFGAKQYRGPLVNGKRWDACHWWDTPMEPLVPLQLAEAAVAGINAGVYALAYWTFADFPDDYRPDYANKWGVFKWTGSDFSTRPHYYGYGLLTKFFRGPAAAVSIVSTEPLVRAAAVRHDAQSTWSIAVVNRRGAATPIELSLAGARGKLKFRKYVYDSAQPPKHPFGDLQPHSATLELRSGRLKDTLVPASLTVYTTAYDDRPPAPVKGLTVEKDQLRWQPSPDRDFCYYRVYRGGKQIGSTIATKFTDDQAGAGAYSVRAVDQSGNESRS